jgi:tetratricopeptide (TPR) repeat protein
MLETIRQYARDKLEQAGEADSARRDHAGYFLALAETFEPEMRRGDAERERWLERLDRDYDNIRATLAWGRENGDPALALRLGRGVLWFWYYRSYFREGRMALEPALVAAEAPGSDVPVAVRAAGHFTIGAQSWLEGDYATSHAHAATSLALYRTLTDRSALAYALTFCGLMTELQGDYPAGRVLEEESVALFQALGDDPWGLALALYWLGDSLQRAGHEYALARPCFEESSRLFRSLGNSWGLSLTSLGLGLVAYRQGDYATAHVEFNTTVAIRRKVRDHWGLAQSLHSLGNVYYKQGALAEAQACFTESLALYRELGDQRATIYVLRNLGAIALARGDLALAGACFRESLARSWPGGKPQRLAGDLLGLARVVAAGGQIARAVQFCGAASALLAAAGAPGLPPETVPALAAARAALGDPAFEAAWAAGEAQSLDRTIVLALDG